MLEGQEVNESREETEVTQLSMKLKEPFYEVSIK